MAKTPGTTKNAGKVEVLAPATADDVFLSRPPLLATESRDDFETLVKALRREIKPNGMIENMYVDDIAAIIWEILRLRRCKTAIIKAAYFDALTTVIAQMSREPQTATAGLTRLPPIISRPFTAEEQKRANLPFAWFHDKKAKEEVAGKLAKFGLDESVMEARAIRSAWDDLEPLDEMLTSLESRRDKCLRQIEAYRQGFAKRVRASLDGITDAEHEDALAPSTAPANTNSAA